MEPATYDEVRRKMADGERDRFSVLIADNEEALVELFTMVQSGDVWWNDGRPHEPVGNGRQRVRFVRLGTAAQEQADREYHRRNR